ncbi:hypothetical protein [Bradyrhizobium embrapense]
MEVRACPLGLGNKRLRFLAVSKILRDLENGRTECCECGLRLCLQSEATLTAKEFQKIEELAVGFGAPVLFKPRCIQLVWRCRQQQDGGPTIGARLKKRAYECVISIFFGEKVSVPLEFIEDDEVRRPIDEHRVGQGAPQIPDKAAGLLAFGSLREFHFDWRTKLLNQGCLESPDKGAGKSSDGRAVPVDKTFPIARYRAAHRVLREAPDEARVGPAKERGQESPLLLLPGMKSRRPPRKRCPGRERIHRDWCFRNGRQWDYIQAIGRRNRGLLYRGVGKVDEPVAVLVRNALAVRDVVDNEGRSPVWACEPLNDLLGNDGFAEADFVSDEKTPRSVRRLEVLTRCSDRGTLKRLWLRHQ